EALGEGVQLDKELHRLVIGRSGKAYAVGDRLSVELESADPARRRITLKLSGAVAGKDQWLRPEDLTSPGSKPRRPVRQGPQRPAPAPPRGSPPGRNSRRKGKPARGR